MKQTKTNTFSFKLIKESQINHLLAAKSDKGVFMRNQGGNGEPDYNFYRNSPAWVVIKYPPCFVVIDIDLFVAAKERPGVKSLDIHLARTLAAYVVDL